MDGAREIIRQYAGGFRLGVAVSGGVDSMTLLHLLAHDGCVDRRNIVVLNVEHGIRGEQSRSDTEFVRRCAQDLGVEIVTRSVDIPALCALSGRSEETEARLARHEFFADMLQSGVVDFVFIAHNLGDRTESVLMHILRGCGINGLVGMKERDGKYIRPLLGVPREKIEAYAAENGVEFVEDATNADSKYNRNFLRNEVLPLLRERYDIDGAIAALSDSAAADEAYLRRAAAAEKFVTVKNGEAAIDGRAFSLDAALFGRIVFYAAAALGRKKDIFAKHIAAVRALIHSENGKRVELGDGLIAAREYDKITLYRESETDEEPAPFSIGLMPFGTGEISIFPTADKPQAGRLIIDGDKVTDDCEIRFRREGDTFKPFGGGTKKLKDYFIDKKIPLRKRGSIPLLCRGSRVLAVFGVEIADEIKVTNDTVNAVELKYSEEV